MSDKPLLKNLYQASVIGINLVLSTFVGLVIGYGLDKFFNTSPWLTIIFLLLGIVAGFRELMRMAKKSLEDDGKDDKKNI
ncbi:MAG: AtpZ/AtpI family protein [Nitrospiraceae bacterium]|nr:AtpZ/AtpI family protein [Nitrospiraceae bacterium]